MKYSVLFLLIFSFFTGRSQDCVDVTQLSHWNHYNIDGGVTVFGDNGVQAIDGSYASMFYNDEDFSGNWLNIYEDKCICFDFYLDYNPEIEPFYGTYYPRITIYTGVNPPHNLTWNSTFVESGTNSATFIFDGNDYVDETTVNLCLPVELGSDGMLPSNEFGHWVIGADDQTDVASWDSIIQNVDGLLLTTDFNTEVSETVRFSNFCATDCENETTEPNCCDTLISELNLIKRELEAIKRLLERKPVELTTQSIMGLDETHYKSLYEGISNDIIVYPNPTTGDIEIKNNSNNKIEKITLIKPDGESMDIESNNSYINIENNKTGTYYLQVHISNMVIVKKVILL